MARETDAAEQATAVDMSIGVERAPVGRSPIERLAEGDTNVTPEEQGEALAWFLADEDDEQPRITLEVNVGIDKPQIVNWTVTTISSERLEELRQQSMRKGANRQQRRRATNRLEEVDTNRLNSLIVFEATIVPDLAEAARRLDVHDPQALLNHRFRAKPILVDQIAGMILEVSGGGETDVQVRNEVEAARG